MNAGDLYRFMTIKLVACLDGMSVMDIFGFIGFTKVAALLAKKSPEATLLHLLLKHFYAGHCAGQHFKIKLNSVTC